MFENITQNNGLTIALSGIFVVFTGLVMIALVIQLFNRLFQRQAATPVTVPETGKKMKPIGKPVNAEHLTAITVALEIYRKLYYSGLESEITFIRGEQQSGWKSGNRYGQRLGKR